MKRYRVMRMDFDFRANLLNMEPNDGWGEEGRVRLAQQKAELLAGLQHQFGSAYADIKAENFRDLGAAPTSVIGYHNQFLREARNAFVIGAYYPALTAAGALGERILNHLILELRDDYQDRPEYKKVYDKQSFDKWTFVIDVLRNWSVLEPDSEQALRELHGVRNSSVHFDPSLPQETRDRALKAVRLISDVVSHQFGAFGPHRWFIPNTMGVSFLTKASTAEPFIQKFYLPSCRLVGARHRLVTRSGGFDVVDDAKYADDDLLDAEFLSAFEEAAKPTND